MYIVDGGTSDSINTYTLSTDWDVSTATFESTFAAGTAVGDNDIVGMTFGNDGYKLYVVGQAQQTVHEFNLSVPYDLSTAVKAQSLYLGTKAKEPCDLFVKEDDKEKFFVMSGQSNKVSEFEIRARAKGNALINSTGNVIGIQVTRVGRGYVEPPTLTIDPPITSRAATVTPVMEAVNLEILFLDILLLMQVLDILPHPRLQFHNHQNTGMLLVKFLWRAVKLQTLMSPIQVQIIIQHQQLHLT